MEQSRSHAVARAHAVSAQHYGKRDPGARIPASEERTPGFTAKLRDNPAQVGDGGSEVAIGIGRRDQLVDHGMMLENLASEWSGRDDDPRIRKGCAQRLHHWGVMDERPQVWLEHWEHKIADALQSRCIQRPISCSAAQDFFRFAYALECCLL